MTSLPKYSSSSIVVVVIDIATVINLLFLLHFERHYFVNRVKECDWNLKISI